MIAEALTFVVILLFGLNLWMLTGVCLAVNEIQRELIRLRLVLLEAFLSEKKREEEGGYSPLEP